MSRTFEAPSNRRFDNRAFLARLNQGDRERMKAFEERLFRRKPKPGSAAELSAKIDKLIELLEKGQNDNE